MFPSIVTAGTLLKKSSSKWIKTKGDAYKNFYWQNWYGAFSVSQSGVDTVKKYIANQKEHHKKKTFKEEYVEILEKYEIEYDEKYIWYWLLFMVTYHALSGLLL